MLKKAIIEHCAPTLAGLKTANMFTFDTKFKNVNKELCFLNKMFNKKGVRIVPIRSGTNKTLFYVYRPERLNSDLCNPTAKSILCSKGYCYTNAENCIVQLAKRLKAETDFPHEIGLFLGYPPEDVKCFIDNPKEGVKCVGCWKAYTNPDKAEEIFAKYKKCTKIYMEEGRKGKPLNRLVVNTLKRPAISVA